VEWTAHPFCKLETKIGRTDGRRNCECRIKVLVKKEGSKARASSRSNICGHCCCLSALWRLSYLREAFSFTVQGIKSWVETDCGYEPIMVYDSYLIFSHFVLVGLSAKSCGLNQLFLEHINFSWSSSILRSKIGKNYKRRMMYYKEKNYVHYFEYPRKKTNMRSFFLLDTFS
jgi:hypothetical protein